MARQNLLRLLALSLFVSLLFLAPPSLHAENLARGHAVRTSFRERDLAQQPRVFAFYYAWFDENSWSPAQVADVPLEPYVSRDPNVIARQIDQAANAGIDSFVVSWLGPGNPTDDRFRMMLDIANQKQFAMSIDFEANRYGSRAALVSALIYVRDQLMPHGAFARVNGKPVLFFWREQVRSVDEWAEIRAQVDPHHDQIWIAEGVNIAYQRVFDGHHLYSIAWSSDVNRTLGDWSQRVRRAGADKFWVATVMPGYDDTRTTRADRFARARSNGDYYRATWNAAIQSRPDMVVITSFNEWVEGSMIEPSVTYGNLYLDLTREFTAQFKSSPPLSVEEKNARAATGTPRPTQALAPPTIVPEPTATLQFPDAYRTTEILRVRAGPGTDYDMLGKLERGFVLDVLARSEDSKWLAIAYPDFGSLGWISAEFVAPQSGFEQFPQEPAVHDEPVVHDEPAVHNEPSFIQEKTVTPTPAPSDDPLPIWY